MSTICYKDYSIVVNAGDCPDWLTVAWAGTPGNPPPENVYSDFGVVTRVFFGGQFGISVNQPGGLSYYADAVGTLAYAGSGCNCQVDLNIDHPVGVETVGAGFQILQDAVVLVDFIWGSLGDGVGLTTNIPFSLAASAGSTITIRGRLTFGPSPPSPRFYTYVTGTPAFPPAYTVAISNV